MATANRSSFVTLFRINFIGLILLLVSKLCSSLNITLLLVPSPITAGEAVELICSYDMGNEKLYSVKWYKDDVEFYRYVPNDFPSGQTLPSEGIKIDLTKSSEKSVYLKRVDLHSEGKYKCEVSGEAPEFKTAEEEKEMKVYVLPQEGPTITGSKTRYNLGDYANLNCTSAKSKPAAILKWYINNEPAPMEFEHEFPIEIFPDRLEASRKNLQFRIDEQHFREGNMKLMCMAKLSGDFSTSIYAALQGNKRPSFLQANQKDAKLGTSSSHSVISISGSVLYSVVRCLMVHLLAAVYCGRHTLFDGL